MKTLVLFLLILPISQSFAAKLADIEFPSSIPIAGKKLVLNGLGLRLATIFSVKVYVGALYLPTKSAKAEEIYKMKGSKKVVLHFVRDVDASDLQEAWVEGFEKNGVEIKNIAKALEQLKTAMVDMKKGQKLEFLISANSLKIKTPAKETQIKDSVMSQSILRLWLGKAPNYELKEGMLGGEGK